MKRVLITGASGSGKTTLIRKLVAHLSRRGLKVGTVKHAHHDFDMDKKGKDSYRHFAAGASVTAVVSPRRSAVFSRANGRDGLWRHFKDCDLVLVEGFRDERLPRIEVFRRAVSRTPLFASEGRRVRAIVTADAVEFAGPRFRPGQIGTIALFILKEL